MMRGKNFIIIIGLLILAQSVGAEKIPIPVVKIPVSQKQAEKDYLKFLAVLKKRYCKSDYEKLSRKHKSLVSYVPELKDGNIDLETIKAGLPELETKWKWLVDVRKRLEKQKKWPNRFQIFKPVEKSIDDLLKLKERHFLHGETAYKVDSESKELLKELKKQYEGLLTELYFFTNYAYPVNHLEQRKLYDKNKTRKSNSQVKLANKVMFQRKLQEDGASDNNHKGSDLFLRTTLNTLSWRLDQDDTWLSEENRYDLEWVIGEMRQHLKKGKARQLERIQSWINRAARAKKFYDELLNENDGKKERKNFVEQQEAGRQLQKFVNSTNAKVYKDLTNEPEYIQALYVFDQILLHEVGDATDANFRDRNDVAQVVINSKFDSDLSVIAKRERFYHYLKDAGVDEKVMETPSWLNVMFKDLRFSFTIYSIPAVQHVFCPDFYVTAVTTRKKNMFLIMDLLKDPQLDFKAIRYYSRQSLVGRFDMRQVWDDFRQIPERAGKKYEDDNGLKKALLKKKYRYLYTFTDPEKRENHVLEIGPKKYAMRGSIEKPDFYAYRDPHNFRFFEAE